jgi:DNA-binding beta-propeller fold protein YncE
MRQTPRFRFYAMTFVLCLGASSLSFASSGSLFTVSVSGANLNIRSNISGRTYSNAGIKINTAGYSLANPGSDCTMNANGYCLFSVNDTSLKTIELSRASGAVNITLCLNANGPLSCQSYDIPLVFLHTAYITNYKTNFYSNPLENTVTKCSIDNDGMLNSCENANATGLDHPIGITLNPAENKAYIANLLANTVSMCTINSNGNFSSCTDSGAGNIFNEPMGIAVSPTNDVAYITNYGNNTISKCLINTSNGTFYSCSNTGSGFAYPQTIVINHAQTFAYIGNINFSLPVSKCAINPSTKALTNCTDSGNTGVSLFYISGMALNNAGNKMYFATNDSSGDSHAGQCPINLSTGNFESCSYSTGDTTNLASAGSMALNENKNLAYVPGNSFFTPKFYACSIVSGSISTCSNDTSVSSTLWLPRGIALAH